MSAKKYRVNLTAEERQELRALVSRGRAEAYRQTHARILLLSDEAQADGPMKDEGIARSLQVGKPCRPPGVVASLGPARRTGSCHRLDLAAGRPCLRRPAAR